MPQAALLVSALPDGPFSQLIVNYIHKLKEHNWQATVITSKAHSSFVSLCQKSHVPVKLLDEEEAASFKNIWQLTRILKSHQAALLHTINSEALALSVFAARLSGIPSVLSVHSPEGASSPKFLWDFQRFVIINSEYLLSKAKAVKTDKIKIIYDDYGSLNAALRPQPVDRDSLHRTWKLRNDSFIVGNISPLIGVSDHDTFLKCIRKLKKKNINAQALIIGQGPKEGELLRLIKEYEIEDDVRIVKEPKNIEELMSLFDCFVLTNYEPMVNPSIYDALIMKIPVILTKIGFYPELVNNEQGGFLVPCGFPERIESIIMRLYANRALIGQFGQAGFDYFQQKLALDQMAANYAQVYENAIKK